MAMIDYGAIVFKNSKLMTHDMFTPMMEAVGWEDTPDMVTPWDKEPIHLKGMYFSYVGDEENTIAFYKEQLTQVHRYQDKIYSKDTEFFNCAKFKWSKWTDIIGHNLCTVRHRNGYYVCKWKYKGDRYKIYFGSGVDIGFYKKWHIVNYYRSIPHYYNKLKWKLGNMIEEIRWRFK